jgi:hypothetical protein
VKRAGARLTNECSVAKLEIILQQPQGDDDGTLYLDSEVIETAVATEMSGRVPPVRFG